MQKEVKQILIESGLSASAAAACAIRIDELYSNKGLNESDRAKTALAALSFSELTVVLAMFSTFLTNEGIIIAAKIAEKAGVPKTTAANALRKLEGAGMIETRSLGAKGMYIKVVCNWFMSELKKFD